MYLYLVQHALSKPKEEDPERGITDAGREETQRIGRFLSGLHLPVDVIWQSGKKRALETAEILGEILRPDGGIKVHEGLNPIDPVLPLLDDLNRTGKDIMIVGHLPYLSHLLSSLITGSDGHPVAAFRNSGILCLEKLETGWAVCWMVTPEILPGD